MSSSFSTEKLSMYYDGIAMTAHSKDAVNLFHHSIKVGKDMVHQSKEKEKLAKDIKEEMDKYCMILKMMSPEKHPTLEHFKQMVTHLPTVPDEHKNNLNYFFGLWVSNVSALLELSVIENDQNNGPLTMKEFGV